MTIEYYTQKPNESLSRGTDPATTLQTWINGDVRHCQSAVRHCRRRYHLARIVSHGATIPIPYVVQEGKWTIEVYWDFRERKERKEVMVVLCLVPAGEALLSAKVNGSSATHPEIMSYS